MDLVAEHMGIHVAQSAIIGQPMVMLSANVMLAALTLHHMDTMLRHHRCYVVLSQATPVLILIRV